MAIAAGDNYEGRAIQGSLQYGETGTGSLQIALNMELREQNKNVVGQMTTFLYFTEDAMVYAFERLRALGWKGKGVEEIDNLGDIYSTWVKCRVKAPEQFRDKDGMTKMGQPKLEIDIGTGTVTLSKPVTPENFKARLKALSGGGGGGGAAPNGGQTPPPF
jgi:hypothetical protein